MIDLRAIRTVKGCEKCITRTALDSVHCDSCLRLVLAEVMEQAARIAENCVDALDRPLGFQLAAVGAALREAVRVPPPTSSTPLPMFNS